MKEKRYLMEFYSFKIIISSENFTEMHFELERGKESPSEKETSTSDQRQLLPNACSIWLIF